MIDKFDGENSFLSNFYTANTVYGGLIYDNNEDAFQAAKVLDDHVRITFTRLEPALAKRKGRQVELRPDWEDVKENIMFEIVRSKFVNNSRLARRLIATKDHILIEGNTWHDNYWGNCSCPKCKNIEGKNTLGKILMHVRKEFEDGFLPLL